MSSSKGSSSSTFTPPPEVVAAYKEALGYGRAAMGQQYQPYTGEITAPLTPTQESGIYNVNRAVGTAIPYFGQATGLTADVAGRTIAPQQFSQEAIQQYQSPYTQAVANATFANLREQQRQEQEALQGQAIRAGAFGGDRAGIAAANMARQQDLATAQAMSQIYNQGYGQAVGLFGQQQGVNLQAQQADAARQMQAAQQLAGLGTGLQGSVLQGAQAQLAAGAQQQAVQQAINSGYYNQYLGAQAYPYQQAQFFANLATGVGGQMGGTTTGQQAQPSPVGSIFGALGAIGSVMSDKRVKENVKPIGKTNDGQTIYRFNYKGDHTTQIGLLAQEVEKKHPEAVTTINGLKGVDYKEATDDSVRSMGGGVVPTSQRHNFAGGGHTIDEEEDPMVPYVSGVPAKVRQIPKLAKIGGSKPNFGGTPPGPTQGPSSKDFAGAAEGLGAIYDKLKSSDSKVSGFENLGKDFEDMLPASAFSAAFAARGGAIGGLRPRFADGKEVPKTDDTIAVSQSDSDPGPGLVPNSDLPPAFRKGEIAPAADSEGTPAGGVVPRPDLPLPPEGRPRDLSFPLLRREEGFIPQTKWDVNAPRHGYSSDTATSPEGNVRRVKAGDTTTREDAERDLTRRVVEGQQWIKSQIGEDNWNRLTPEAQAAMTSIRYQYGQYPQGVLKAAMTGDNEAVAQAIATTPGPTPARRAAEAALVRGQDQGLAAYEPEGARYLKGGLGAVGGGGGSRKAQEASIAATDAESGDRKWNFGMAGEGKRSVIESMMNRDFDPIQKRALFAFFAGMAASPSPWFGQQLGAGMQAASNVYNDSLNKQAELDIKGKQLGLEEQKIGVSERTAAVQEKAKALETLKYWLSQYTSFTDPAGNKKYRDPQGNILSQQEYDARVGELMKEFNVISGGASSIPPKTGVAPTTPPAGVTAPEGGVVPKEKPPVSPEVGGVEKPAATTEAAPVKIPEPTKVAETAKTEEAKPAQQKAEVSFDQRMKTEKDQSKIPIDDDNPIMLRQEAQKFTDASTKAFAQGDAKSGEEYAKRATDYRTRANDIINGKTQVTFKDGNTGYIEEFQRATRAKEREQEFSKENLKTNTKWREDAGATLEQIPEYIQSLDNIAEILQVYKPNLVGDQLTKFTQLADAIGLPVTDEMMANADNFYKIMKENINLVYKRLEQIGGRVLQVEVQGLGASMPSGTLTPEAARKLTAQLKAAAEYTRQYNEDLVKNVPFGPDLGTFDRPKYIMDWKKQNPISDYVKVYDQEIAARGATPNDVNRLKDGRVYILEDGQYGVFANNPRINLPEGSPIKVRYHGLKKNPQTGKMEPAFLPEK